MATPTEANHEIPKHETAPVARTSAVPLHPLDPLTEVELEEAVRILREGDHLGDMVRVVSLNLIEPARDVIEKPKLGDSFERKALAVLLDRGEHSAYEVALDLLSKAVASVKQLPPGIQPSIMLDEFIECELAVRRSLLFQAALEKRGVTDADLVMVEPGPLGVTARNWRKIKDCEECGRSA